MPQWFSTFVEFVANWAAGLVGTVVVGIAIALVIVTMLFIAWQRRRQPVAQDQEYRKVLRKFVLVSVGYMNGAINKVQEEMTERYGYGDQNRDALNNLFGQGFDQAIRVRYREVERLVKLNADLSEIEEALRRYMNNYRALPGMLSNFTSHYPA